MTHLRVREHLTVIGGLSRPSPGGFSAPLPLIPVRAGYEHLTTHERSRQPAVATRRALLQRLALLEAIAPAAPVSFLLVGIEALAALDDSGQLNSPIVLGEVAGALTRLTRPTDLVGSVENATFGVVLQGRTAGSAALIGARVRHHLNLLAVMRHPLGATVATASGTGTNAGALVAIATEAMAQARLVPVG